VVKVKICGITNLEDALAALDAGCDALGFMFYRKSPRYIKPAQAKKIISQLPKGIIKIGVFVNAKKADIVRIAKLCGLNMLQFHGNESPEFCSQFRGHKIIKAFRIKDKLDLKKVLRYKTFAYLFDTFVKSKLGGTGKQFNWNLLNQADSIKQPIFLSGGLGPGNVARAIKIAQPEWVDASSSLEISPGKKDVLKLKKFIKKVRKAR